MTPESGGLRGDPGTRVGVGGGRPVTAGFAKGRGRQKQLRGCGAGWDFSKRMETFQALGELEEP